MLKNVSNLIFFICIVLFVSSCNNDEFMSPFDPSYSLPAPSHLEIQQIAINQCRLTWRDNSQTESAFRIARKQDDQAWNESYASLGRDVEEYIDEEVSLGSNYTYKVIAFYEDIDSDSSEASINITFNAPTNLQISQESLSSIKLTWEDNCPGEEGFKISRKKDDEDWVDEFALVGENIVEYLDNSVQSFSNYSYRIRAYYHDVTSSYVENYISLIPVNFVLLPAGTFTMGNTRGQGYSDEEPTHQVTLSSFFIGKYEVMQADYQTVMGINPSYFSGQDKPVESISWFDAVLFCNALSIEQGLTPCYNTATWFCDFSANGYRLPTEAEWEYAARGSSNNPDYLYSGSDDIENVAWNSSNSSSQTHDVGTKNPNSLGIYDMSGNVWEWCNDWYGLYSSSAQTDPVGPATGSYRVFRGGCWCSSASYCRVAIRNYVYPTSGSISIGFRLARRAN